MTTMLRDWFGTLWTREVEIQEAVLSPKDKAAGKKPKWREAATWVVRPGARKEGEGEAASAPPSPMRKINPDEKVGPQTKV